MESWWDRGGAQALTRPLVQQLQVAQLKAQEPVRAHSIVIYLTSLTNS